MYSSFARNLVLFMLALLITGCASHREAWNQVYGVPVNSTVRLLQPLTIPVRDTQVFIQEGTSKYEESPFGSQDQYYPFCYFEVADISESPQIIEPDTFIVTAVSRDETDVIAEAAPIRVAGPLLAQAGGGGSVRMIVRMTVMRLHSDRQPQMRKLVCAGGFDLESWAKLPTIKDIELALGNVAKLDIPGR